MVTLYPFQIIGRDFLSMNRNVLLADDCGLGKTLMAIEALKQLKTENALVICPLGVRRTWFKVIQNQYPGAFIKELQSVHSFPDVKAINIVNYDIVWRKPLVERLKLHWKVLICDESHYLKNIESKRTKALLGRDGLYSRCEYRWMMTGTPILNRPIELYAILRSLCPEKMGDFRDYYKYAYKFCAAHRDTFGFNTDGASNLPELAQILGPFMLRRMKEDVLAQLPPIQYEKIYLDPTDMLVDLTNKEKRLEETPEVKSIRRSIGILKIKPAILHIEDLLLTKDKIVAFTWHKDVAHGLKDHFKTRAVVFTGEENVAEKETAKAAFISSPDVQVFIGQLETAGIGIDGLQEVCDCCVFVEMFGVPGKIKQAVDRLRRIGQDRSVLAQFLIVEDSVDEKIVDTLIDKSKNIKIILNEKGGPQFVTFICSMCKKVFEMAELKRLAGLSVCKRCKKLLEDL